MKEDPQALDNTNSKIDPKPAINLEQVSPGQVIISDNSDKKTAQPNDGHYKTDDKKPQLSNLDKAIAFIAFALLFMAILPILGPAMGFPIPNFIPTIPLEVGYGLGLPMAGYSGYKFIKNLNDQDKHKQVASDNALQSQQDKGPDNQKALSQEVGKAQDLSAIDEKGSGLSPSLKDQAGKIASEMSSKQLGEHKGDSERLADSQALAPRANSLGSSRSG